MEGEREKGNQPSASVLLPSHLLPVPLIGQTQLKANWLQSPMMQTENSQLPREESRTEKEPEIGQKRITRK